MMADELELPIEIIQNIQSYLDGKLAAQTVVLSKPWFHAWSTRPTLYFNEQYFTHYHELLNAAGQTLKRYKDSKLYVNEFVLIMTSTMTSYNYKTRTHTCHADDLIMDALNLCGHEFALTVKYNGPFLWYVLPAQLLAATSLTRLNLSGCMFNNGRVLFPRLKSLVLDKVYVTDEEFCDILSGCPLIEELSLAYCKGLRTVDVSKVCKLVELSVSARINVEFGLEVVEFRYLRTLQFTWVILGKEFFDRFLSRFPCVEKLHLEHVPCKYLEISSRSLRYLNVLHCMETKNMRLRFDIPNIKRFVFKGGYDIPSVSFGGNVSMDWVSDVQFGFSDVSDDSLFVDLRNFLTGLSPSRISLHIKFSGKCDVLAKKIPCFPIPMVDNLSVDASRESPTSPSMWNCLFWSCRPSFITECKSPVWWEKGHDPCILHDLYNLLRGDDLLYRMYNLEDVNLEVLDKNLMEWQTIPLVTLIDILIKDHQDEDFRFRFSWAAGGFTG